MKPDILPHEDEVYRMYKATQQILGENGYQQYEISNFAKKGYECRHNIGYWTRTNYLGLGLGAASLIENVRCTNTRDVYKYISGSENIIETTPVERKEQMEEFMFLGLRMMEGVSERKFYENFGRRFEEVFPGVIEKHEKLGLLEVTGEEFVHLRLTPHGIDVSNQVFVDFML